MPLARLLLISFAVLAILGVVTATVPPLRRALPRARVMAALAAMSVASSAASSVIRTSGGSGTGTRTSHGFPKPFYFTWTSWEAAASSAGIEWLYFAGNCVAWLAFLSALVVLFAAARVRPRGSSPFAGEEGR